MDKDYLLKMFLKIIEDYLNKEMPDTFNSDKEFIEKAWELACIKLAHIKQGYNPPATEK